MKCPKCGSTDLENDYEINNWAVLFGVIMIFIMPLGALYIFYCIKKYQKCKKCHYRWR